jgi:predicted deacetylase
MIPSPAQYLLRFDDLCPTMARDRWERFVPLIEEFGIRPILAVVPDNRDPELELAPPDPEFWSRMRTMQAAGATIGLHGYRHLCASRGRSLVPLHRKSEFAGVPEEIQRTWIQAGLEILRGHDLNAQIWVAPRHGFDCATLRTLQREGITTISDGLTHIPFRLDVVTWIPQQLWAPVEKRSGLWTICVHSNTAANSLVDKLREFLGAHAGQFTSVEHLVAELKPKELEMIERLYGVGALWRARSSQFRKSLAVAIRNAI